MTCSPRLSSKTVYFDLSELFFISSARLPYYGIARTIVEVAYELMQLNAGVKFVVFSPSHQKFLTIKPKATPENYENLLSLQIPEGARPIHIRRSFPTSGVLRNLLFPAVDWVVQCINKRRLMALRDVELVEADLAGQSLVSFSRPKIMVDFLIALEKQGVSLDFYPLLHDMIPLHDIEVGNQTPFSNKFAYDNNIVIRNARAVLVNSEFTKREVEFFSKAAFLTAELPEIIVVPLSHEFNWTAHSVPYSLPEEPYFLCVGAQTGRKNLECVFAALLKLKTSRRPVPNLLIAGARRKRTMKYLTQPEFDEIRHLVEFRFNPTQSHLGQLYEGALAVVVPSRIEGWGLPLGEAMWLGTPAIGSDIEALREVGGDFALYFDPDAPAQLAEILDCLHTNSKAHEGLVKKIAGARSTLRSWSEVAHDVFLAAK